MDASRSGQVCLEVQPQAFRRPVERRWTWMATACCPSANQRFTTTQRSDSSRNLDGRPRGHPRRNPKRTRPKGEPRTSLSAGAQDLDGHAPLVRQRAYLGAQRREVLDPPRPGDHRHDETWAHHLAVIDQGPVKAEEPTSSAVSWSRYTFMPPGRRRPPCNKTSNVCFRA